MCLTTLWPKERIVALKAKGPIKAFKVVRIFNAKDKSRSLYGPIFGSNYKLNYQVNHARVKLNGRPEYQLAFHAYLTRRAAMKHSSGPNRIIPCLMWDITAVGKQNGQTVVVARKMILLTEY